MPGQALLKATLLKETYVPLVDLNGAEKIHGVVRVLPSRLSLMERRFLDQIAPKVFPAREQFNDLRQAARLQRAGFQVQDVIKVYERLIAASAAKSKGYTTLAPVDEDFELSPVKLQSPVPTPNQDACDIGFDRSAQLGPKSSPGSSPEQTLTSYRNAIFENVMFQLEEKWRESNWDDTEHTIGFPNEENLTEGEPGRTRLTGGPDGGRSEEDLDVMSRSVSSEASERDWNPSPYFEDNDTVGSLEISFEIPVARGSPEEDNSAIMTTTSWGYYLGCYSTSPSSTISRGSTANSTPSTPTTGTQTIGSINSKMVESAVASMIQPTVDNNGGENVTKQSGESVDEESPDDYSDTFLSFGRPDESRNSLRNLLNGDSDAQISSNGGLFPQDFVSQINNITHEDDEVNGERSLMSTLRHSREVDHDVGHVEQSKGNFTDGRDQHLTDVEKSGSDRAGVEARQLSPSRLSEVSQNSSTKCNGDSHHGSIGRLSKTFGNSKSMKESSVPPDAKQDLSGRRAVLAESVENSSATHGDSQHRSIGRSSPTFFRSLSMKESVPAAKQDFSSRRAGVPTITQNSPADADCNSRHRSPGRDSRTVLRSLSMNDSTVIVEAKQDFSSRKAGVPDKAPNSTDKSHGGSQHRSLERFSRFFGKCKSMKERLVSTAVKQDFSATASPAEIHGSLDRPAKPSLARRTIEKIQGMPGRTTRLQPVVDSTASEKQISHESHVDTTPPHEEPLHNNNSDIALSFTQVVHGKDAGPAVKPRERSRPNLGTLFEDARDTETEKLFVEACSGCIMSPSLKSIFGYRKGIFRIKPISSWLHGVGWMNNSSKVGASKGMDEISPKELPKGSLAGRRATINRKWRRSPRSSPKRMMMSPKRKADRGRYNRKPIKILVGTKAKEVKQSRSRNRAVSNEGRPIEASNKKIHPVGCILEGRPNVDSSATAATLAVNVGVFTDMNHSGGRDQTGDMNHTGGRNQTGKEQVHPIPGLRHLRSRSTSSRFLREYMARQEEMVQSQTVGVGG